MTDNELQDYAQHEARNLLALGAELGQVYLAHRLFVMFLRVTGRLEQLGGLSLAEVLPNEPEPHCCVRDGCLK